MNNFLIAFLFPVEHHEGSIGIAEKMLDGALSLELANVTVV